MPRPSRLRDAAIAGLIGLVMAVVVGLGSLLLAAAAARESVPTLTQAMQAGTDTVGRAVADQLGRALSYGIPLDGLVGLDGYFGRIVAGSPTIEALALHDPSGRPVFETRPGVAGAVHVISVAGEDRARLVLAMAPPLVGPAIDRLWIALVANAVLVGLLGGLLSFLLLAGHFAGARQRLRALMLAVTQTRFPRPPPLEGRGPVAAANRAFDQCLSELRAAAKVLSDSAATLRAIDFDGSLARRMDPVIQPVAGVLPLAETGEGAPAARVERRTGALWLAVVAVGVYAMVVPYVANFAIDRTWGRAAPAWWPVLPVVTEAACALVAFVLALRLPPIWRPLLAAAGLLAAGAATGAIHWIRDYVLFLELRGLAAAGLGAAVAGLAGRRAASTAVPVLPVLLLAALVAGPAFGGLIGEAVGRRVGFLLAGCALVLLAPLPFALRRTNGAGEGARRIRAPRAPLGLLPWLAAGAALGATVLVWLPAVPGYEDYLATGLLAAAAGLAAAVLPARPGLLAAVLAVAGMLAAGEATTLAEGAGPGAVLALRVAGFLALGSGVAGLLDWRRRGLDAALVPLGLGLAAGAGAVALSVLTGLPALALPALLVAALGAAAGLAGRRDPRPGSA